MSEEIQGEIEQLVEDIEEENPELLEIKEILQSPQYKLWYHVIKNTGKQLIDYAIEKKLFQGLVSGEKSLDAKVKKEKTKSQHLSNIELENVTEKAYMFRDSKKLVCWFPKKAVKYDDTTKKLEILGWWIDTTNENNEPITWKTDK